MAQGVFGHGDVVWCKCGGLYWPAEVQSIDSLPAEIREGFLKTPKVVVKFFDEDGYEFIHNEKGIFPYNCEKKTEFITKGLARAKTKAREGAIDGWFAKFPKDVVKCEKLTKGNVNILEEEPFVERKVTKVDYSLIFGEQEESVKKTPSRAGRSSRESPGPRGQNRDSGPVQRITHPRFLSQGSDHTVRILSQPSTPYHMVGSSAASTPQPAPPRYNCHMCGFAASRLNVIVLHTKSHSEPGRSSLANHARPRADNQGSSPRLAQPRKRVVSPKGKKESTKKPRLTKKLKEIKKVEEKGKEEKKIAIFGDWSEDEIEEMEEKEKLRESIASKIESIEVENDSDNESIDDMFNFTDDHHSLDSDDDFSVNKPTFIQKPASESKPLRKRKADLQSFIKEQEKPKPRRKIYEKPIKVSKIGTKPSAADAISSLIKSKLQGCELKTGKKTLYLETSEKSPQIGEFKADAKQKETENSLKTQSSDKDPSPDIDKVLSETCLPSLPSLPAPCLGSGSESATTVTSSADEQEPASPPPTRKPGILRKSSHLSIQLPTRPNGNSVVIRHKDTSSPTKYAAISAKAKAKQLARSAMAEGNKQDPLVTAEESPQAQVEVRETLEPPKPLQVETVNVVAIDSVPTQTAQTTLLSSPAKVAAEPRAFKILDLSINSPTPSMVKSPFLTPEPSYDSTANPTTEGFSPSPLKSETQAEISRVKLTPIMPLVENTDVVGAKTAKASIETTAFSTVDLTKNSTTPSVMKPILLVSEPSPLVPVKPFTQTMGLTKTETPTFSQEKSTKQLFNSASPTKPDLTAVKPDTPTFRPANSDQQAFSPTQADSQTIITPEPKTPIYNPPKSTSPASSPKAINTPTLSLVKTNTPVLSPTKLNGDAPTPVKHNMPTSLLSLPYKQALSPAKLNTPTTIPVKPNKQTLSPKKPVITPSSPTMPNMATLSSPKPNTVTSLTMPDTLSLSPVKSSIPAFHPPKSIWAKSTPEQPKIPASLPAKPKPQTLIPAKLDTPITILTKPEMTTCIPSIPNLEITIPTNDNTLCMPVKSNNTTLLEKSSPQLVSNVLLDGSAATVKAAEAQTTASPMPIPPIASARLPVIAPSPGKPNSNQVRLVHNPVLLPKAPSNTVFIQRSPGQQMILPKPPSRPVLLPKPPANPVRTTQGPVLLPKSPSHALLPKSPKPLVPPVMRSPNSKPTIITVGKALQPSPTKTPPKPAAMEKPCLASSKPLASLASDKPVVAGVPRALGGISLSKPPGTQGQGDKPKPLTVSLEAKGPAVGERSKVPQVKTVELPRKVVEASRQAEAKLAAPVPTPAPVQEQAKQLVLEGASLGAESLAALSQLQVLGEDGNGEEMIYLMVDEGSDPNLALENQTLYIDASQLAGLTMGGDHMILQENGSAGPLVLQVSGTDGQVMMMMPEKSSSVLPPLSSCLGLVTSADTTGGMATLPSHPSSSLLAQVPLITTPSQQGPIMVSTTEEQQ